MTGSSSGIGFKTALTLARIRFYTYAKMRNLSLRYQKIANKKALLLKVIQLDVASDRDLSAKNAIQEIISEKQWIDILVNNVSYELL